MAIWGLWSVNHRDLYDGFEDRTIYCPENGKTEFFKQAERKKEILSSERITTQKEAWLMFIKLKHASQCFQQPQQLNSVTLLPRDSFLARQHPGHTPEKYESISLFKTTGDYCTFIAFRADQKDMYAQNVPHTWRTPFSERVKSVLRELSIAICTMGSVERSNKMFQSALIRHISFTPPGNVNLLLTIFREGELKNRRD